MPEKDQIVHIRFSFKAKSDPDYAKEAEFLQQNYGKLKDFEIYTAEKINDD